VITYRVRLDVPGELVLFVSRLLARHRKEIGTRKGTRSLGCYRQALFGLAWYRDKADIPRLGAGFGLSQATSYRYVAEITTVVSAQAPGLEEALERAVAEGTPYVILDGKIVSADRCHEKTVSRKGREIDLWYSGKKKDFGGNIQGLFYPDGLPMWISDVVPGNVHDLAAAREEVLPVLRNYTDRMPGLADCGYEGAGHGILTPVKKPKGVKELDINGPSKLTVVVLLRGYFSLCCPDGLWSCAWCLVCRRCGRACAGWRGCGSRRPCGLRAWRAG
jgi:hypothetical protein